MTAWFFEVVMLLAFGLSWPASIYKSLTTHFVRGKSPIFMIIVIIGYLAGIVHKLLNPPAADAGFIADNVIWLYVIDAILVMFDLTLYFLFRNNTEVK